MRSFLAELKRRHVYRVGVAYAIVGWLLIQIATQVFPFFHIPDWAVRLLVLLVLAGFPLALVLAWAFDATPQGIVRTDANGSSPKRSHRTIVAVGAIGVLFAAIAGAGYWWWHRPPASASDSAVVESNAMSPSANAQAAVAATKPANAIPDKSVAVLPFESLSEEKNNAYFAAGMQDMILTKLADIGDLKVIARTSTEKYASHPDDLKTIAQQLGVATILEGSVQKSGNQVLINVQLIDANTDAHLWAEAYPRTLDNIFGVEGEVAQKVADALNARLTPVEARHVSAIPTRNPQAYDLYLQGDYYWRRAQGSLSTADFDAAIRNYRAATEQDPQFALAFARLAITQLFDVQFNGDPGAHLAAAARTAVDHALTLAPGLPDAYLAQGYYEDYARRNLDTALKAFQTALKLKPQNSEAILAIGIIHKHRGRYDAAIAAYQHALELDPRNVIAIIELTVGYMAERRYAEAVRSAERGLAIDPDSLSLRVFLCRVVFDQTASTERALAVLNAAPARAQNDPQMMFARISLLTMRRDYAAARVLLERVPGSFGFPGSVDQAKGDLEWDGGDRAGARAYYLRSSALMETGLKADPKFAEVTHADLGWNYARLGRRSDALEQGRIAIEAAPIGRDFVAGRDALLGMAKIQAQIGEAGAAIATLDRLLALPTGGSLSVDELRLYPTWDPIRNDPRFQALLKKYANESATKNAGGDQAIGHY